MRRINESSRSVDWLTCQVMTVGALEQGPCSLVFLLLDIEASDNIVNVC